MQRRIFKIPDTPHFDHWVLEIDDEFVHLRRLLFGLQRHVIATGHQFLGKKYPNYLDLPFEGWAEFDSDATPVPPAPYRESDPALQRNWDRLWELRVAQPKNFFRLFHAEIALCEEISERAIFHPAFGVICPSPYIGWTTERFSPAFKNIVLVHLEKDGFDLETAAARYSLLEKTIPGLLPEMWSILHKRFREVVEMTDPDSYFVPLPEVRADEEIEPLVTFTDIDIWNAGYIIRGKCDWDDEHGFQLSIDQSFNIGLDW